MKTAAGPICKLVIAPFKFTPYAVNAQHPTVVGMINQHLPKGWGDVEGVVATMRLDEDVGIENVGARGSHGVPPTIKDCAYCSKVLP